MLAALITSSSIPCFVRILAAANAFSTISPQATTVKSLPERRMFDLPIWNASVVTFGPPVRDKRR